MKTLTISPFVSLALALIVIMNLVMPLHSDALTAAQTSPQEDIGLTHFAALLSEMSTAI